MNYRRAIAISGAIINVLFIVLAIHFILKFHREWEIAGIPPNIRLKYDEELLRFACYEVLPGYIVVMSLSAVLLWIFRK